MAALPVPGRRSAAAGCRPAVRSSHAVSSTSPRGASAASIWREQRLVRAAGRRSARFRTCWSAATAGSGTSRSARPAPGRTHTCQAWPSSMTLTSPGVLPLEQHRLQHPVGAELAEPGHLDVGRVTRRSARSAAAPRSRDRADAADATTLRARLVTHSGGVPRGASAAKSAAIWLSSTISSARAQANRRPAVCGARSGAARRSAERAARPSSVVGLPPVAEQQHAVAPQAVQVEQVGRVVHIGVGLIGRQVAPPEHVDLGEQRDPDHRGEVPGRAARAVPVGPDLAQHPPCGCLRPGRRRREDHREGRVGQSRGQPALRFCGGQAVAPPAS